MNLIIDVNPINPYNDGILRNIIFLQYLPISIGLVDQMGTRFDRLRYWNLRGILTSIVEWHSVATIPTACGIETGRRIPIPSKNNCWLQQYLPLAVLKHQFIIVSPLICANVATVPTVYGMRRRVRDGRGAKRRWSPHISSTWAKRR